MKEYDLLPEGKTMKRKIIFANVLTIAVSAIILSGTCKMQEAVYAAESTDKIEGKQYQFDSDSHYDFENAVEDDINNIVPKGELRIAGDMKSDGEENGVNKYDVNEGNLKITYINSENKDQENENNWEITEDDSNQIDEEKTNDKIQNGAVLIQTSLDGKKWIKSAEWTNFFSDRNSDSIYETSGIQLLNGCYFRIVVAYKESMKTGTEKILFMNKENYDYRKIAEVYEFYAVNEKANKNAASSENEPRKELGKLINTGKNNGYSGKNDITSKDAHYGWRIGTFVVNGYTQEQEKNDGTPVFLKNVGDQVTLWFKLNQNIDELNKNKNLIVADDKDGYDQNFQTKKTDMGRGTLIIRYTDCQNHMHEPVIYTNYLAACSTTSADTRVALYEEGDYEVALDYELKSTPRKVGGINVLPEYYDYRVEFKFSVHNGNAMVYPFDVSTGAELQNRAVTPNGFRIDLANSKDLDVFVDRSVLTKNKNGRHIEDSRGKKAAKNGSVYTQEGIYTVYVINTYTGMENKKTIYVGNDPFMIALANTDYSVKELDDVIAKGYSLTENGTVVLPSDTTELPKENSNKKDASIENTKTSSISEEAENLKDGNLAEIEKSRNNTVIAIGIVAIIAFSMIFGYTILKTKKDAEGKDDPHEEDVQ